MISGIQHEIDSGKYNKDPEALQSKLKEKEKAAALRYVARSQRIMPACSCA